MRASNCSLMAGCALCLMTGIMKVGAIQSSPNVQYQNRGYYREGVRTSPSTGAANLVLISALIDYDEGYSALPSNFSASFYLPKEPHESGAVHLAIREIKPVYYYWLAEVKPPGGWRLGSTNHFKWPTDTVIRFLNYRREEGPLGLAKLAAVVRLGRESPGNRERVAPVALYHSHPPPLADGYRFVFHPDRKMRLTFQVLSEREVAVSEPQNFPSVPAGLPKDVSFSARTWGDGWYMLQVSGYSTDMPVDVQVRFFHSRRLER